MHEQEKLNEAGYFARCMESSTDDPEAFQYELSAFLSAARSVLQYAFEEVKQKPNGQQWYEAQVTSEFFTAFDMENGENRRRSGYGSPPAFR